MGVSKTLPDFRTAASSVIVQSQAARNSPCLTVEPPFEMVEMDLSALEERVLAWMTTSTPPWYGNSELNFPATKSPTGRISEDTHSTLLRSMKGLSRSPLA